MAVIQPRKLGKPDVVSQSVAGRRQLDNGIQQQQVVNVEGAKNHYPEKRQIETTELTLDNLVLHTGIATRDQEIWHLQQYSPGPAPLSSARRHRRQLPVSRSGNLRLTSSVRPSFVVKAESEEDDAKLYASMEKRWDAMIRDGKIQAMSSKEAAKATQQGRYFLLDVRPKEEYDKAHVEGSVHVPMYDKEEKTDLAILGRKLYTFLFGGWWIGAQVLARNPNFLAEVSKRIGKEDKLVVVCQKGKRSLLAAEMLLSVGWLPGNVAWLNSGFENASNDHFKPGSIKGTKGDLRLAGLGGMSEFLGFTDVQRSMDLPITQRLIYSGRLIGMFLALDLALLYWWQHRN
eukprot:jgi/Mesvir1/26689/Mv20469-RA.1